MTIKFINRYRLAGMGYRTAITAGAALWLTGCANLPVAWPRSPATAPAAIVEVAGARSTWYFSSLELCALDDPALLSELPAGDLWERLTAGFVLPPSKSTETTKHLNWLLKHPLHLREVSGRAAPYLYHIVQAIEARGLPQELALIPFVESAFDPFAYSHVRAAGLWQVLPSTGKWLGLKLNWWYDGRRDVVAGTEAALDYLSQLNRRFDGDWLLTLAAYNAGQGTVSRAIRANRARGAPTDYWSLPLPPETRRYVPKLLAVKQLLEQRATLRPQLASIPDRPYFTAVETGGQINLSHAAELAGLDLEEFYALNPGFNRWATDPDGPHLLLVPAERSLSFSEGLSLLGAEDRVVWERHVVRSGETLLALAQRNDTTAAALMRANNLHNSKIRAGETLLLPRVGGAVALTAPPPAATEAAARVVADDAVRKVRQASLYRVVDGDSLWRIARAQGVSIKDLKSWNPLTRERALRPGDTLTIWRESLAHPAPSKLTQKKLDYTVRRGDNLSVIAARYGLRVRDILSWNDMKPGRYLQPGQLLTLFVDVTASN